MAQCISRLESSIYGGMTEGITHCRIVMEKGGGETEHRGRDESTEIVALTMVCRSRRHIPNVLFVENSKHTQDNCDSGAVYGTEDRRGVVRTLILRNSV